MFHIKMPVIFANEYAPYTRNDVVFQNNSYLPPKPHPKPSPKSNTVKPTSTQAIVKTAVKSTSSTVKTVTRVKKS